jgi:hypothetical protein
MERDPNCGDALGSSRAALPAWSICIQAGPRVRVNPPGQRARRPKKWTPDSLLMISSPGKQSARQTLDQRLPRCLHHGDCREVNTLRQQKLDLVFAC